MVIQPYGTDRTQLEGGIAILDHSLEQNLLGGVSRFNSHSGSLTCLRVA